MKNIDEQFVNMDVIEFVECMKVCKKRLDLIMSGEFKGFVPPDGATMKECSDFSLNKAEKCDEQNDRDTAFFWHILALTTGFVHSCECSENIRAFANMSNLEIMKYHDQHSTKPIFADLYCNVGDAFAKLGGYKHAAKFYDNAIYISPDHYIARLKKMLMDSKTE